MIEYVQIQNKISPQLIREISGVLDEMHSGEGFLIRDDQGIAILAEDKGIVPLVFSFSIPVPLTVDDGRRLLSICERTCDRLGIDKSSPNKMILGCFDLLNELITNETATFNISELAGAYHVQKLLNRGIDLEEQVSTNINHAKRRDLEGKFSIFQNNKLIQFEGDVGPRLRP